MFFSGNLCSKKVFEKAVEDFFLFILLFLKILLPQVEKEQNQIEKGQK